MGSSQKNLGNGEGKKNNLLIRTLKVLFLTVSFFICLIIFMAGIILVPFSIFAASLQGVYYDLFGRDYAVRTILGIFGTILLVLGGICVNFFIGRFRERRAKVNVRKATPLVKISAILIIVVLGLLGNYYMPKLSVQLNISHPNFGPYIAIHGENAMLISWDTSKPEKSKLIWGLDPNILNETALGGEYYWIPENGDTTHHTVRISGLKPDTTYYYSIPQLGDKIYSFHTPPTTDSGKPVLFTIVGDTQGGYQIQKKNVAWMKQSGHYPNFTMIAGDLVNRDDAFYEWAMVFDESSYGGLAHYIPWMNAPGNHEFSCSNPGCGFRESYRKYFQYNYPGNRTIQEGAADYGMYYSFNYSNVHMVVLDNFENETYTREHDKTTGTYFTQAQLEWLERDLANNDNNWKFLVFHVPMYSSGDFGSNEILAKQLEPIIEEYGVDAVFYGHDHHFEVFSRNYDKLNKTTYFFVIGGGGGGLDPMENIERYGDRAWPSRSINRTANPDEFDQRFGMHYGHQYELYGEIIHHYMEVKVVGNKAIFTAYRSNDHSIIVQYELVKN